MRKLLGLKNTTVAKRDAIFSMAESLVHHAEITKVFGCHVRPIQRVLKKERGTGHTNGALRSGRPLKITGRGLHQLKKIVDIDRQQTLGNTTNSVNNFLPSPVAPRTVKMALNDQLEVSSCHAHQKLFFKEVHVMLRKDWAREATRWGTEQWKRIIWTDESSVVLGKTSRHPLV